MNKEITLEEYVLTNLHPGDWGYYIRLKDNIEYQVYKRKPRGQKLYYFIKKDNEEIRLDEEVRKCFLIIYEADKLINLQFGIINELTDDLKKLNKVKIMRIKDIIIPKEFQKPRTEKMNERIEYFKKNQNFETQIVVDKDNNLIDGYTTYLIAKKYGINFINVINNS